MQTDGMFQCLFERSADADWLQEAVGPQTELGSRPCTGALWPSVPFGPGNNRFAQGSNIVDEE